MRRNLIDNIAMIVGFIGSIITIGTFMGLHVGIKLPKIEIDVGYLYSKYGKYMLIIFLSLFIIAIFI